MLAQTWSEHCKHKIFASKISYTDKDAGPSETINSLYKTCIMNTTKRIRESLGDKDFCRSVFKDNAGVIAFTPEYDACIKVGNAQQPLGPRPLRRGADRHRGREPRPDGHRPRRGAHLQHRRVLLRVPLP